MYKSKCTCAHRHPSQHVRAWNFTHEPDCYYAEVRRQEAQHMKTKDIERLYKGMRLLDKSGA